MSLETPAFCSIMLCLLFESKRFLRLFVLCEHLLSLHLHFLMFVYFLFFYLSSSCFMVNSASLIPALRYCQRSDLSNIHTHTHTHGIYLPIFMLSSLYGVWAYMWPSQSSWTCVFSFSPIKGHDTNYRDHALLAVSHEIHICSHYRHLKEVNICGWRQSDSSITLGLDRIIKAVRNNWRYPFTSFQLWPLTFISLTHTHSRSLIVCPAAGILSHMIL